MSAINNMRKMIILMETATGVNPYAPAVVRLHEGKVKELWMLIKQGKSAEEIAEILNVDVATIESLMAKEEIGEADASAAEQIASKLNLTKVQDGGWFEAMTDRKENYRALLQQLGFVEKTPGQLTDSTSYLANHPDGSTAMWNYRDPSEDGNETLAILAPGVDYLDEPEDEEGLGEDEEYRGGDEVGDFRNRFQAHKYVELYTTIAKISAEAVSDIKRLNAAGDFDETSSWDLAERNMKPILQAIEEVYDINSVLDK